MTNELRAWSSKRTLIDYNSIEGDFGKPVLICVDRAILAIMAKYIAQRGRWKSSYIASIANDRQYYTITDDQLDNLHNYVDDFLSDYGGIEQMNCDIVGALEAIAASMGAQNCGCGSNGGPAVSPPLETETFGDPTSPTGTPPAGYADWNSYRQRKCDIASWIVSNLENDLTWIIAIDVGAITASALAVGLLSLLSAGTIAVLAGLLLIIAGIGISIVTFALAAVQASFDDLVCALFTGESAAESISQFETVMSDAIDAETADAINRLLLKQLTSYFLDSAQINLMYAPATEVEGYQIPTGGDCSSCGLDCQTHFTLFGEQVSETVWEGEPDGTGDWRLDIHFFSTDGLLNCSGACGPEMQFKLAGLSGWSDPGTSPSNFRIWADTDCPITSTNASVYNSDTQPSTATSYCGRRLSILSDSAFQATLDLEGAC